jgi:hypothetical protein
MESLERINCSLSPAENDILDELFKTNHLKFKTILAENSSLEFSLIKIVLLVLIRDQEKLHIEPSPGSWIL